MAERVVLVVHKKPVEVRPTTKPVEVRVSPKVAQVQPAEKNITIIEPEKKVTDLLVAADQGPPGPPGPEGLTWRGPWDANADYVEDDAVEYNGSSYVAVVPSKGVPPPSDSSKWHLLAAGGSVDGGEW